MRQRADLGLTRGELAAQRRELRRHGLFGERTYLLERLGVPVRLLLQQLLQLRVLTAQHFVPLRCDLLRMLVGFSPLDFPHCLQCPLGGLLELLERLLGETLPQAELGGALRAGDPRIESQKQLLDDFRLFRHLSGPQ